jgi:LacI family transcriptional regulator
VARLYGYHVLIYLTHESAEQEIAFTRSLLGGRVDGLLISLSQTSHSYEHITELNSKIPVVLFDRVSEQVPASKVTTDDYGSSYKATQHLVQQGCRSILYLSALNRLAAGQKRKQGYTDALQAAGISLREELVIDCDHDDTTALIRQAITTLQPDAIFSSIEKLSTTCYHLLHELGLSIPQDIKIASFSNLDNAALLCPPLTTVVQPAFEIGKAAAEILFRLLQKKTTVTEEKEIASELIVRESTKREG